MDKLDKVTQAARALIRAEYNFRLGPRAYRDETTEWYLEALADLNEAVTGHRSLRAAGEHLNPAPIKRKKLPKRKRLPTKRAARGLFS